jgi:hypothetical protein
MVNEIFPSFGFSAQIGTNAVRFAPLLHALWKSRNGSPATIKMFSIRQYEFDRGLSIHRSHRASGFFA